VEKQTTTSGQVVLQTKTTTMQTNITGEVRREDISINKAGESTGATGAAESPGGTAAAAGGTITDATMLSASSEGKQCQLTGLKVKKVINEKVVVLDAGNGQQIFAFTKEGTSANTGDLVNISGVIKTSADSSVGQAAQDLSGAPYYIQADKCEVSNK
jgi:hypothetical protein